MSFSLVRNGLLAVAVAVVMVACGGGGDAGNSGASGGQSSGAPGSATSGSTDSGGATSGTNGSSGSDGSSSGSGTSSGSGGSSGTGSGGTSGSGSTGSGVSGTGAAGGGSSSGGSETTPPPPAKSAKRGIAYDLADPMDLQALSPGVSWWYNWSPQPNSGVPSNYPTQYQMDFYPMIWGVNYDLNAIESYLLANPNIKYLLVMNEPNLTDQAKLTPQQAAAIWPDFEAIAAKTGVKIVGPAITWGTMAGYNDPVVWLDAFYTAYEAANNNQPPQIDYLAFHWYDYGLSDQLDRLKKYGKPFWVTEFANWHSQTDGAQIDTLAKQEAQMTDMVATCESRADVFRYAWFTGRVSPDPHFSSLLGAPGQLTILGQLYLTLPYTN
jgi:Glycosyl hydrolase catalytic core